MNEVVIVLGLWTGAYCTFADFEEPTSIELKDGRLVIIGRNRMGRLFQAFSTDSGVRWGLAEPTELTSSYGPAEIRRIPTTGDLLICWNQVSKQEVIDGLNRHRVSVAISTDEGKTWGNFKNIYSLDDYNYVRPDSPQIIVPGDQWVKHGLGKVDDRGDVGLENVYVVPVNSSRYYRKPASVRSGYPMLCITDKNVLVSYEMGKPGPLTTALDVFPIDWLYKPIVPKGPYARLVIDSHPVEGADLTIEDGTPFGWADVLGGALGDFEPPPKRIRVPVRSFLENYGVSVAEGDWHPKDGPNGTLYASRGKK